jgi:hypothetical protein
MPNNSAPHTSDRHWLLSAQLHGWLSSRSNAVILLEFFSIMNAQEKESTRSLLQKYYKPLDRHLDLSVPKPDQPDAAWHYLQSMPKDDLIFWISSLDDDLFGNYRLALQFPFSNLDPKTRAELDRLERERREWEDENR